MLMAAEAARASWYEPTLMEKVEIVEQEGLETLMYCPHPWAVRRKWENGETGETHRVRCNRWECLYCGPRKVAMWRRLVREAQPTLFLTLTKAGKTVQEARRALTTFIQALRRGSKGRGPNHVGAREAYPVEYFAVLERHEDFERVGFHWHLLLSGVEHIPFEVLQTLWMSATHYNEETGEGAKFVSIKRVRDVRVVGYVTKYLMKAVAVGEWGRRTVKRVQEGMSLVPVEGVVDERGMPFQYELRRSEQGQPVMEQVVEEVEVESRARRLCYSRGFFPLQVADLRKRLFAGVTEPLEGESEGEEEEEEEAAAEERPKRSPWRLLDVAEEEEAEIERYEARRSIEELGRLEEGDGCIEERAEVKRGALAEVAEEVRVLRLGLYQQCKRDRLIEVLEEMQEGRFFLPRTVINVWHAHRKLLRLAG
jgi:hypothetical protein